MTQICSDSSYYYRAFLKGDVIEWETESWDLKTPLQSSEEEVLDLERDICNAPERGLYMVPHKLTFEESVHTCKKLSGSLFSYTSSQEFDDLLYFLSLSANMRAGGCVEKLEDGNNIEVWAGGTDEDKEGDFVTWNTKEPIQHLPWGVNRPYNDGDLYNCLVIETLMKDVGKPHFESGKVTVGDEVKVLFLVWFSLTKFYCRNVASPTVRFVDLTRK